MELSDSETGRSFFLRRDLSARSLNVYILLTHFRQSREIPTLSQTSVVRLTLDFFRRRRLFTRRFSYRKKL